MNTLCLIGVYQFIAYLSAEDFKEVVNSAYQANYAPPPCLNDEPPVDLEDDDLKKTRVNPQSEFGQYCLGPQLV